jgi:Flp pilus assembly protein TadG
MRWLTMRRRDDRGAVAIIVAILVPALLLGLGALVLDVGSWYAQRAQTQNGADAGALAVAQSCATGNCDLSALAQSLAPANSNGTIDTTSVVSAGFPCGAAPRSTTPLPACSGAVENGTACPEAPAAGTPYVDVHVNTHNTSTGTSLVSSFVGKGGKEIGACAQASWGPPGSLGRSVAITMSSCEWNKDTADSTQFGAVPAWNSDGTPDYAYRQNVPNGLPSYLDTVTARSADTAYTDPKTGQNFYTENTITDPHKTTRTYSYSGSLTTARIAGSETVLTPHGFGNNCTAGNPGSTSPGQFSWLSNDTCTIDITGPTYPGVSGNSSAPCEAAFTTSRNTGKPIYLPVYSDVASGTYTLLGFAAFVVTGWDITSGNAGNWTVKKAPSLVALADPGPYKSGSGDTSNYCGKKYTGSASDVCVYGFFTQALIPPSALPGGGTGGNDLGATSVQLTG